MATIGCRIQEFDHGFWCRIYCSFEWAVFVNKIRRIHMYDESRDLIDAQKGACADRDLGDDVFT